MSEDTAVQTEGLNLAVVEEGVFNAFTPPSTGWYNLQPNSLGNFGSQYKKTPRDPISKNLQLRKPMLTDQDSAMPFEHDITKDVIDRFAPGIFRSRARHSGGTAKSQWSVLAVTSTGYTVDEEGDLPQRTLVYVRNSGNPTNDGLKLVAASSTTTEIKVAGLVADASVPANCTIEVAGYRFATGDANMTAAGNLATTTKDLTELGLDSEQWVVVGGRQDDALYSLDNLTYQGAAKIDLVAANLLTFSRRTWAVVPAFTFTVVFATDLATSSVPHLMETGFGPFTLTGADLPDGLATATPYWAIVTGDSTFKFASSYANAIAGTPINLIDNGTGTHTMVPADPGTGQELEIYFSRWYRNVPMDHADFYKPSYAFEVTYPELATDSGDEYLYALGNMIDEAKFTFPLTGKATINFSFVGCRTRKPTATRITGPSSALDPVTDAGVSTSTDLQRLRITGVDEAGIGTDFTSLSITCKNNVSAQKSLARLGARHLNQGKHTSMVEAEAIFTTSEIVNAVRDNRDSCLDILMRNEDFGALFDVQKMTLDSSDPKLERNKIVSMSSKATGFQDVLSTDSLSVFAYLPELPEEDQ